MTRYRLFLCSLLFSEVLIAPVMAAPDPPKVTYDAFDLALGRIPVFRLSNEANTGNRITKAGSTLTCLTMTKQGSVVVVIPNPDNTCPIFAAREPDTFSVVVTTHDGNDLHDRPFTVAFEKGKDFSGPVSFDGANLHIGGQIRAPGINEVCLAYYSSTGSKWEMQERNIPPGGAVDEVVVSLPRIDHSGTIYLRYGSCPKTGSGNEFSVASVKRLTYPSLVMQDLPTNPPVSKTSFDCSNEKSDPSGFEPYATEANGRPNYEICIDQANSLGQARIISNKYHYITTFAFGKIKIRHWKNVVPVVNIAGSGVSLQRPGLVGATNATSVTSAAATAALVTEGFALPVSLDGQGISGSTNGEWLVSTVFVPPHAPGALHLDIRFLDPVNAKPRAATSIDLVVDQGYSGALRFGIGHVFRARDYSYSALQRGAGLPKEIVETSASSNEVVVGYALYLDGLGWRSPAGRTYAVRTVTTWGILSRHLGLYVGFGALSYSPGAFDFLKSIHAGVDIEFSRNLSIAVTLVGRRTTQLDGGLQPGGPAPDGDLPTSSRYDMGWGVVVNLSTDFVRFATNSPTAGSSK